MSTLDARGKADLFVAHGDDIVVFTALSHGLAGIEDKSMTQLNCG